jgi:hypothetical protein
MDWTGATNTPTLAGSQPLFIYGNMTLISAMNWTKGANVLFEATSTGKTVTTFNKTATSTIMFNGIGGGWTLQDDLSAVSVLINNGSFDSNGKTITASDSIVSSYSTARSITLGASAITFGSNWTFTDTTGLTWDAGTSTITMTGATSTFAGGGLTYNNVTLQGSTTITGANTFATLTLTADKTTTFPAGATQTVTTPVFSGTNGHLVTMRSSSAGTAATISKAAGTVKSKYCSIQDITATGGATWIWTLVASGTATAMVSPTATAAVIRAIHTGIANTKGAAFVFSDKWHYLDGTKFWQYDGTTFAEIVGRVPTVTLDRTPTGGGTVNEDYNYISDSFKDSFSGTVGDTVYTVSQIALTSVDHVWVAGTLMTVDVDYTVDLVNGQVTFGVSPGTGTNNVVTQSTKTGLMDDTMIKKCKYWELFGGQNDTRIFLTGNPNNPATVYWCNVADPTYWPESNYNMVGSDSDFAKGLKFQYDQLILLKQRSVYRIEYNITDAGVVSFPSYPLNSYIGCDCPETIQLIDNMIVFNNSVKGPQIITRTDARTEKNVMPIGGLINGNVDRPGLLSATTANLQAATSFDDGQHYIICVDDEAWAWDYKNSPYGGNESALIWWPWLNINANCWLEKAGDFYFGDRDVGLVYKMTDTKNDDGTAINGVWRSKLNDFGMREWWKSILYVYFATNVRNYGNITVKIIDDYGDTVYTETVTSASFSWDTFDWDTFTWAVAKFDPVFRLKPKVKKSKYFQVEFSNDELNEELSILDVKFYWTRDRLVK